MKQPINMFWSYFRRLNSSLIVLIIYCSLKLLWSQDSLRYQTMWVGNSFGGGNCHAQAVTICKWVQMMIVNMEVRADGTVYTHSDWDESHRECGIYKNGDVLGNQCVGANSKTTVLADGSRWTIQGREVVKEGTNVKITTVEYPSAVAIDHSNKNNLLIADDGKRQQVLIYDISKNPPELTGTFGVDGGLYSGVPGKIEPLKFYGISGIGRDAQGNFYVACGYNHRGYKEGTDLRCYQPDGTMKWRLMGHLWLDCADFDRSSDGVHIYSKLQHYVVNYNGQAGKNWESVGYTLDPFTYPDDPRIHLRACDGVTLRIVKGHKIMGVHNMMSAFLCLYRFIPGTDIAAPCGLFTQVKLESNFASKDKWLGKNYPEWPRDQPLGKDQWNTKWFWVDKNGDGAFQKDEYQFLEWFNFGWAWDMDNNGDVWFASETGIDNNQKCIYQYPCQGFTDKGVPIYTLESRKIYPMPQEFSQILRIRYFEATDDMYLSGYTKENPKKGNEWGIVGTEVIRYTNWSKKPQLKCRAIIPYTGEFGDGIGSELATYAKSMDVAGNRIFTVNCKRPERVWVHCAETGKMLGTITPGAEVGYHYGWVDISKGINAMLASNGDYLVLVEDDSKNKNILYRIPSKDIPHAAPLVNPSKPKLRIATLRPLVLGINTSASIINRKSAVKMFDFHGRPLPLRWNEITARQATGVYLNCIQ